MGFSEILFDYNLLTQLFAFILSLLCRFLVVRNSTVNFDTYGHLYFTKEVQTQKTTPWGSIKLNVWESNTWRHPFLWHWIIAKFTLDTVFRHQKWINPFLDAVYSFALFKILMIMGFGIETSFLGMLLYLFTPMWFSRISIGPRISSLTPRLISELLFNALLILLVLDFGISPIIKITISMVLTVMIILSSKFGVQALILIIPLVSLFIQDITPLVVLIIGFLLVILISKGEVLGMFGEQISHLKTYFDRNKKGLVFVSNRNNISDIIKKIKDEQRNYVEILWSFLSINSYTSTLLKMPIVFLIFILVAYQYLVNDLFIFNEALVIVLSAVVVFFVINHPKLLFLGEAERYLNHVSFFIVIAFIDLALKSNSQWAILLVIIYGFCYWMIEITIVDKFWPQSQRNDADDKIELYLMNKHGTKTVLNYPYHAFGVFRILLRTHHRVLYPLFSNDGVREGFINEYEEKYPFINLRKLDEIAKLTQADLLIINEESARKNGYENWKPSDYWVKVDLGQTTYGIYERILS